MIEVIIMCLRYRENSLMKVREFFTHGLKRSTKYKFFNFKFSKMAKFKLKGDKDTVYEMLGDSLHNQFSLFLRRN
jgi:hypothetical protein